VSILCWHQYPLSNTFSFIEKRLILFTILCREELLASTGDHDGSYSVPPLPPRTPAPQLPLPPRYTQHASPLPGSDTAHLFAPSSAALADLSPLTQASASLPRKMRMEAMTPRSRAPVIVCSSSQLDKWDRLIPRQAIKDPFYFSVPVNSKKK
jgi:hypothetical protein